MQKLPIVSGEKLIKLLLNLGYEIVRQRGSHVRLRKQTEVGEHNITLDVLSYEEQLNEIKKAKNLIESIAGRIESFRAPALRLNEDTVKVLEETGFTSDSSVCPQRFDGPLTFGAKRKLKWLVAPRKP